MRAAAFCLFLFLQVLLPALPCPAQRPLRDPYAAVDARALRIQAPTVDSLARRLVAPYTNDSLRYRALFRWVTANIAYDVHGFHDTCDLYAHHFTGKGFATNAAAEENYTLCVAEQIFNERRGVCEGYARLFKALCDYAGLPCEIVHGVARHLGNRVGLPDGGSHAWNAIRLGGRWQLLDATWASGYSDSAVTRFIRHFKPEYYLSEPKRLFNNHYPDQPQWTLLGLVPDRAQFFDYPYFQQHFYDFGLTSYLPARGHLYAPKGGLLRFAVGLDRPPGCLQIVEFPFEEDPAENESSASFARVPGSETLEEALATNGRCGTLNGNTLTLDYRVKSARARRLDVYVDGVWLMSYGLTVTP
jgi:hypothetical protein